MLKKGLFIFIFFACIIAVNSVNYSTCNQTIPSGFHYLNQSILNYTGGTCFDFSADNVTFDCQGYSIEGNDSFASYGFLINLNSNVTIKNCYISHFYYGAWFYNSNNGGIENVSSSNNYIGINVYNSSNLVLDVFEVNNNSNVGVQVYSSSSNNSLSNFFSYDNGDMGVELGSNSNSNTITNFETYNNSAHGIMIQNSLNNVFNNFSSINNTYGVLLYPGTNNNSFTNFSSFSNNYGLYFYNSNNDFFDNFEISDSLYNGILFFLDSGFNILNNFNLSNSGSNGIVVLASSNNNILSNFTSSNNSGAGIFLNDTFNNVLNNFTVNINSFGIYIGNASSNIFNAIKSFNNTADGIYFFGAYNNTVSNFLSYANGDDGVQIFTSSNNSFSNFSSYNNADDGIYVHTSFHNLFENFSSYNNSAYGFYSQNPYGNNTFDKFNLNNNNYGLILFAEFNNTFRNFLVWNNTIDGVNFNTINDSVFNNFSSYANGDDGVQIFNSTQLILNDFRIYDNLDRGLLLFDMSNLNLISNFDIYNNSDIGVQIYNSLNNNLQNFTSYDNGNDGVNLFINSNYNVLNNFSSYNNGDDGVQVYNLSSNNNFSNFRVYANGDDGVFISIGSNNNTFFNSNSSSNIGYNLNLYYSGLAYSIGNIFYNNTFGSSFEFSSNYDFNTNINYFNSSLSGFNLGNLWDDFNSCLLTELRGGENVCINPTNFTINITNNVFDLAPLYPLSTTPSMNLTYTSFDNTSVFRNWTYIEVLASSNISSCGLNWNGTWDYSTTIVGGNTCYINKSDSYGIGGSGNSYWHYLEANSSLGVVNQSLNISVSFYLPIEFSNHNLSFLNNNSVQINWSSNSNLNSTIYYWKNLSVNMTSSNLSLLMNHSYDLVGLDNLTTYFYSMENCYSSDNMCNSFGPFNFTTLGSNGSMNGSGGGNSSYNVTTLNSCQTINESGYYNLSNDVSNMNGTCFEIVVDNVELDCLGRSIVGNISVDFIPAIHLNNSDNLSILNCNINSSNLGIYTNNVNILNLNNINISDGNLAGIIGINVSNSNVDNIKTNNFLSGINFINSTNINFNNINHSNFINAGFIVEDSDNVIINNSYTFGGSYGVYNTYSTAGPYLNNQILNSQFLNLDYYGIRVDPEFNNGIYKNLIISGIDSSITYGIRNYAHGGLFENITFNGDFEYGFYFYGGASNNSLRNSNFNLTNFDYDLYFNEGLGTLNNNSIYNNYLTNASKIYFVDSFSTIYFNSSYMGENIGNYWSDLSCLSTEIRGNFTVCTNPSQYTINGIISAYDYAPMPFSILSANIITPLNDSTINVSSKSINFQASFSKDLDSLGYWVSGNFFNLSDDISGLSINQNITLLDYGYQEIIFLFEDLGGYILNKSIFVNVSLVFVNSSGFDIDGDGINNSLDNLNGFSSNVNSNFPLIVEVNGSSNLSQIFNSVLSLNFKEGSNDLIILNNDFSSNSIDLSNITIIKRDVINSSGILVNGLSLDGSNLKTFYLNLSGDLARYSSLCIKDEEVNTFDEISLSCSGSNEYYIHSLPYTGSYNINYYSNSSSLVEIIGLSNSAAIQVCTENWIYGDWSTCSGSSQSRTSSDLNLCGTTFTRAALTQSCTDPDSPDTGGGGGGGGGGSDDEEEEEEEEEILLNETDENLNSTLDLTNQSSNNNISNNLNNTGSEGSIFIGDMSKLEIYKSISLNKDYSFNFAEYTYNGYFTLTNEGVVFVSNNGRGIELKNNYGKVDVNSDGISDFELVINEVSGNYILNGKKLESEEIIEIVEDDTNNNDNSIDYGDLDSEGDDFIDDLGSNLNETETSKDNNLWIIIAIILFVVVAFGFGTFVYLKKKKIAAVSNLASLGGDLSHSNGVNSGVSNGFGNSNNSYYGRESSSLNNIRSTRPIIPDNADGTVDVRDHIELINTPEPGPLVIKNLAKCRNSKDVFNLVDNFEKNLNKLIKNENDVIDELKIVRNNLLDEGYSRTDIYAYLKENNVLNYLANRILSFDELTDKLEEFFKQDGFENLNGEEIKNKLLDEEWFTQCYNYSGDGKDIMNDVLFMLAGTKIYGFIKERFNDVFQDEMKFGIKNNLRSENVPKHMDLDKLLKLENNIYFYEKMIEELELNLNKMGMPKDEKEKIKTK
ncbi:MAG: right-handed parallel beta-helix repeat-containing protein, partial [Nanoarchaeota archaeon]|nr:right-handed parallel beta-helix repeat-containing protein [Nanoarchaeota archaeon]